MRKLIVWNVVTLDGCFEGEKPWDLSFHNLVWGPELEALSMEQLSEADMIIFGANTYRGMASHWPNAEGEDAKVAPIMNTIRKIVCSSTIDKVEWNNTTIVRDAVKELSQIKKEGDGPMYIFGSALLCESLLNAGLIDEIRLCVAPIVLGKGRHLFTDHAMTRTIKLRDARALQIGGVILRYESHSEE